MDIPFDILYINLFGIFFGHLFGLSIFWPFFRIFSFIFSGTLSGVLMAYLLVFYLAVEGRRAHWAHRVPVWWTWNEVRGPAVPSQIGAVRPFQLVSSRAHCVRQLASLAKSWQGRSRHGSGGKCGGGEARKEKTCFWLNIKIQSINNKQIYYYSDLTCFLIFFSIQNVLFH